MRSAAAQFLNHRGNGGCGVTFFVCGGHFVHAFMCLPLFHQAVRRRVSALHQGIVQETFPANLPPSAVGLGERLRHTIENIIVSESSSPRKRHRLPSSRTRRSMDEGPFLFPTPATLKLPGEMEEETFSHHAVRGTSGPLGLIGLFIAILPSTMDVWVDNTSPQGAANKGSSKSHAMML
ncbi:protein kinase [Trypanosoma cruzi]|nr:protein kinase [Trypanosoma cruzi]